MLKPGKTSMDSLMLIALQRIFDGSVEIGCDGFKRIYLRNITGEQCYPDIQNMVP